MIDMKFQTLRYEEGRLYFLDQTKLPLEVVEEEQTSVEQVWDSIKKLKVRGAPAIGVAGAYGLVLAMKSQIDKKASQFMEILKERAEYLDSSRPTAVNLSWALDLLRRKAEESFKKGAGAVGIFQDIELEAIRIHQEDIRLCLAMGEAGAPLIKDGMGVLTHCNAGALATSGIGTATAPMYMAHERGIPFRVYADETRPLLQGARLTSWELHQAGIDVTLISDNMAAAMMAGGLIDLVIVGTDRVAANGDVANKIGTMAVAILARHFNIPFYVACPASTVDMNTAEGKDILIEERDSDEITNFGARQTGPDGVKVRNPAFDVTPAELVTALITDKGIVTQPLKEKLKELYS